LKVLVDKSFIFYVFKRSFDILASLFVSVFVLSWLLPVLALIIKIDSRGPVFFVQKRVGRGGRTFLCVKLRTMVPNGEANTQQAVENDNRITRVGRFLRNTNLDEFPQFFNVLLGQMSIVGPRPHMLADCEAFAKDIPDYDLRNLVKPGITGLAQVKGYRGPITDFKGILRRYQYDAFYIRHANVWLDLRIIHQTIIQTLASLAKPFKRKPSQQEASIPDYTKIAA
jgi:putative colanic acid biosynthesis UDP-glucose lipid carrier transferase